MGQVASALMSGGLRTSAEAFAPRGNAPALVTAVNKAIGGLKARRAEGGLSAIVARRLLDHCPQSPQAFLFARAAASRADTCRHGNAQRRTARPASRARGRNLARSADRGGGAGKAGTRVWGRGSQGDRPADAMAGGAAADRAGWGGIQISSLSGEPARTAGAPRCPAKIGLETGRAFREREIGERVEEICRRSVQVGDRKLALLEHSREFSLVPWRPVLEKQVGHEISGVVRRSGVSWSLGCVRAGSEIGF